MIHIILGTRAQLIKMAPIMKELQDRGIKYNFIFMAQHKETMYSMLDMFGLKRPDFVIGDLDKDITSVETMIKWSIKSLIYGIFNQEKIFRGDENGIVLIHGDAPPAFLGALMAKSAGLKVGQVESGLRSFSLLNPFPEEITRILTFPLVDYYFCQDNVSIKNVKKYNGIKVNTKFNTLIDSLRLAIRNEKKIKVNVPKEKYCVVTIHRFENISNKERFEEIIKIIEDTSKKLKVLFILHPPTKAKLEKYNLIDRLKKNKNIELRPRYDYFEFIKIMNKSEFIISDGGSNQEECFYLGKPCLLLRNETERKEGLGKNAVLSKFNSKLIDNFLNNYKRYKIPSTKDTMSPTTIIINKIRKFE